MKTDVGDLAAFGGNRLFVTPKPVSNLPKPDFDRFMAYLRPAYDAGTFNGGTVTRQLELRLARFHEVEHCVAFNSGFWALAAVMRTVALPGRDEVLMPSLTYRRMADIAGWVGLKPHFCEVDRVSMTNTAECVRPHLNAQTAMVIGVHPINGLADIDGLAELAKANAVPLVFDSVESVYESHGGRRVGSFGAAEVFSLGASKLINGFEGGYVTTGSAEIARRLRAVLRAPDDRAAPAGFAFNGLLSDIHAAMALSCLDEIDRQIERNRGRYLAYREHLGGIDGIRLMQFDEADRPGYKNIVVEVTSAWPLTRDETIEILNAEMILARAYYPQPLHSRPMRYPHVTAPLPVTEDMAQRYMLLPCGELVSQEDIGVICDFLRQVARHAGPIRQQLTTRVAT